MLPESPSHMGYRAGILYFGSGDLKKNSCSHFCEKKIQSLHLRGNNSSLGNASGMVKCGHTLAYQSIFIAVDSHGPILLSLDATGKKRGAKAQSHQLPATSVNASFWVLAHSKCCIEIVWNRRIAWSSNSYWFEDHKVFKKQVCECWSSRIRGLLVNACVGVLLTSLCHPFVQNHMELHYNCTAC